MAQFFNKSDFFSNDARSYLEQQKAQLKADVKAMSKAVLQGQSDDHLASQLVSKFTITAARLRRDEMTLVEEGEGKEPASNFGQVMHVRNPHALIDVAHVKVAIPFDGDDRCFFLRPSTFDSGGAPSGYQVLNGELMLTATSRTRDAAEIKRKLDEQARRFITWLNYVEQNVVPYNAELPQVARGAIAARRQELNAHQSMLSGLGIPVRVKARADAPSYSPVQRVVRPTTTPAPKTAETPYPVLPEADFDHILSVMENMAVVMERSPKAFIDAGEETIRFHFLVQLNGHFRGEATGETFNQGGKTDILIRHDGRNIFIAECKFWTGEKAFLATIDQILSYSQWRDSKVAVVVFNTRENFSGVLDTIKAAVPKHANHKRLITQKSATHLRYEFKHPQDAERSLFVAVLAFNVPH